MRQLSHMTFSYLPLEILFFNSLDDEYFTIPYITDVIPNLPASCQLQSQAKRYLWIVAINGEEPITSKGVLDELNCHQTPRGKSTSI